MVSNGDMCENYENVKCENSCEVKDVKHEEEDLILKNAEMWVKRDLSS